MTIVLTPMSQDELDRRLPEMIENYAQFNTTSDGLSIEDARRASVEQHLAILPDGVRTGGMMLLTARDDRAGAVGWIWLALPGNPAGGPGLAWVYDVEVDAAHRGRGHGRAIMLAAERELAERGIGAVGLNVHGSNPTAVRLYDSLGFTAYRRQLVKPLTRAERTDTPEGGADVALRAMSQDDLEARLPAIVAGFTEEYAGTPRGVSLPDAREQAERMVAKRLPDGVHSTETLLRTAHAPDGTEVGWCWVSLPGGFGGPGRAWVMNLVVGPACRGRGYGRAMVLAVERELAERGVPVVGAQVAGGNVAANRLADRLGYALASQQMAKRLTAG
ncbi:GNAT family N-acetyltransferase [Plantactinospora sp. GCM10030261]|uniref:GNAT family N-acetyltransferase n=1 Tax=Plantactinospora sp. GCM10030261 TaxID=3273420 RepID=UPI003613EFBC